MGFGEQGKLVGRKPRGGVCRSRTLEQPVHVILGGTELALADLPGSVPVTLKSRSRRAALASQEGIALPSDMSNTRAAGGGATDNPWLVPAEVSLWCEDAEHGVGHGAPVAAPAEPVVLGS